MKRNNNYQVNNNPIKLQNTGLILDIVRKQGPISRNVVAEMANISPATVSRIVDSLISDGILVETGVGECTGGRRPVMLDVNFRAGFVIGIDAGIDNVVGVLTDLSNSVVASCTKFVDITDYSMSLIQSIKECIQDLIDKANSLGKKVFEIGLALRGLVDRVDDKLFLYGPGLPMTGKIVIDLQNLASEVGVSITVENYLKAYSLVHIAFGSVKDMDRFAYFDIDEQAGGCLMICERNSDEFVEQLNQLEHMIVDPNGPSCECGGLGCLGAIVNSTRIVKVLSEKVKRGSGSILTGIFEHDEVNSQDILTEMFVNARLGDELCLGVVKEILFYLGIAIGNVVNMTGIYTILISGYVADSGEWVVDELYKNAKARVVSPYRHSLKILPVKKGKMTGALGASIRAMMSICNKDAETQLEIYKGAY